jgi:Tfp pilus assembly protein PilO
LAVLIAPGNARTMIYDPFAGRIVTLIVLGHLCAFCFRRIRGNRMNRKSEKRHLKNTEKFKQKLNSAANLALRKEIFRLARIRDILGLILIFSVVAIIALSVLLFRLW